MMTRGLALLLAVAVAGTLAGCDLLGLWSVDPIVGQIRDFEGGTGRLSIAGEAPVALELQPDSQRHDLGVDIHLAGDGWDVIVFAYESGQEHNLILRRDDTRVEALDGGYRCEYDIVDSGTAVTGSISCTKLRLKSLEDRDEFVELEMDLEFDVRG